ARRPAAPGQRRGTAPAAPRLAPPTAGRAGTGCPHPARRRRATGSRPTPRAAGTSCPRASARATAAPTRPPRRSTSPSGSRGACRAGLGLRRVLADHVERGQVAALHRLEHLRQVPAVAWLDLDVPRAFELAARLVILLQVLEAGQSVRDRAHVPAALHVVLAA